MTESTADRYEFPLVWAGAYKWTICLCVGHVVGSSEYEAREVWQVVIDETRSCRVESEELSTPQLELSALPPEVQTEAKLLVGRILNLDRVCVEYGLVQYIWAPEPV